MIRVMLDLIAPDHCYMCGKIGSTLCASCVYNIMSEGFGRCILCLAPTTVDNLCGACKGTLTRAWVVGERTEVLQRLTDDSKFCSNRRACKSQAELISRILPVLPQDTLVVPVPTIWPHIRQRGYGHAERIALDLARMRGLNYATPLKRITNSVQHGSSRAERLKQAAKAFRGEGLPSEVPVLLVDDVCTTGASLLEASKVLRAAGATEVWAAVTTRQMIG